MGVQACGVDDIPYIDVLSDAELRIAAKQYSSWATFPQVYVHREFIGGADIILEMFKSGALLELLKQHNLVQTLNPKPS